MGHGNHPRLTLIVSMTLLFFTSLANSHVPTLVNFQGFLTEPGGEPVADGDYPVTFTIYDAVIGGNSKWIETQTVTTTSGLFSVLLGSVNPLLDTVFSDASRYLGIQIGDDPESAPRSRLASVPFAHRIASVDGASGGVLKSSLLFSDSLTLYSDPMMYIFEEAPDSPTTRNIFTRAPFWDEYGLLYHYAAPGLEYFDFKNGPTVMSIHMASHRVGIGTDAPETELDVNGTLRATGAELGVNPNRSGFQSTIGGGGQNETSASWATVAGGALNVAGGEAATVSGGYTNSANGNYAVSPGGRFCDATGNYTFAAGRRAKAMHEGTFVWADQTDADFSSSTAGQFQIRATGGANIYSNAALSSGVTLPAGGSAWSSICDSTFKENIRPVDGEEILILLQKLPISRWNYIAQNDGVEHIGPMAQDFYRLFNVGEDDKHISTLDPDGITLAAAKQLAIENEELKARISRLEDILSDLLEIE